jgi:hypothetical protein
MPRFRKGTTDHDKDGRMGGSMKGDTDMVKVKGASPKAKTVSKVAPKAKAPGKAKIEAKAAEKPVAPKGPTPEQIEAADVEASIGRHPGGMEPPLTEDEAKAKLEAEFAEADRKADPRFDEAQAIHAVRGF